MGSTTKIEWTEATWNPISGCTKVSPGCDNCYAERMIDRFKGKGAFGNLVLSDEKLRAPLKWRTPKRVFVNSMSDLFHKDVPDDFIAKVFAVMACTPQHTYQVLTKRPGRMRSLLSNPDFQVWVALAALEFRDSVLSCPWPLRNVWLGVSVEDQRWADVRIPLLLQTPAAVRWLSCEPLLGPLDLYAALRSKLPTDLRADWDVAVNWVVVGGESGAGARPMDLAWAESAVKQCREADVPVFVKQLGSRWGKNHHDIDLFPEVLRVREYPKAVTA